MRKLCVRDAYNSPGLSILQLTKNKLKCDTLKRAAASKILRLPTENFAPVLIYAQ